MSDEQHYHIPVMLAECIDALDIKPNGIYVDVTFGGGGHSIEILKRLENGKLFGFDQDEDAVANVPEDKNFTLIRQNFKYLKNYLRMYGIKQIDGLLADLGVSSHQFDAGERGFSTRFEGPLDMRMDKKTKLTAKTIVNTYEEDKLKLILGRYGELKNGGKVARTLISKRAEQKINTTAELKTALESCAPAHKPNQFYAKVFQALRIEVNGEMDALEALLEQAAEIIKPGGRLVVMSYHSLEDRPVKNYIKTGKTHGAVEKDFFGNMIKPFKALQSKPIVANEKEIERNSRARSAKLRVATRGESYEL